MKNNDMQNKCGSQRGCALDEYLLPYANYNRNTISNVKSIRKKSIRKRNDFSLVLQDIRQIRRQGSMV